MTTMASVNVTALEQLPNPFTPLAFLPTTLADQFEISRYMYTITLGAFMWDLAVNLDSDYYLLFKHRIRMPTIVYYISRISTLAYILTSTVFQIGNVGNCQALQIALGICYLIGGASTSFLFFLRVRAVFHRDKYIVAIFFVLWLSVVGGFFTVPFAVAGAHIGTTKACINTAVRSFSAASVITTIINDSLIFFAISHRVLSITAIHDDSFKGKLKVFFGGSDLPAMSRALLQGGQQYYLITVGGNVVLIVLVFLQGIPILYHGMFTIPNLALENAMACLVFRRIKFGLIAADGTSHFATSSINTRTESGNSLPWHGSAANRSNDGNSMTYAPNKTIRTMRSNMTEVEVTKTVEHDPPIPLEVLLPAKRAESYDQETSRTENEPSS